MVPTMMSLQVLFSFCLMRRQGFWWCRWLEWILTKWRYRCLWTSDSVVVSLVTSSTKHLCISGDVFVDVKRKDRETNGKTLLSLLSCPPLSPSVSEKKLQEREEEETGTTMCNKSESETLLLTSSLFFLIFVLFFLFWSVSSNNRLSVTSCVATTKTEEANRENYSKKEGGFCWKCN